ncbi:MAG: BACON domain-containing protein, partial [Deltaproteobacteria bacterium]|nr:BACON domain-containing protein [Deltaproteobacteria bacterium]
MKKLLLSIFIAGFLISATDFGKSIAGGPPGKIHVSPQQLNFATNGSQSPPAQSIMISNTGGWTLFWNVMSSSHWLSCSPSSGTNCGQVDINVSTYGMMPGNYTGTITVSSLYASNSPQIINVNVYVYEKGTTTTPFGSFDTPIDGSTVSSSVPLTGWVLDDVGVNNVKIYRGEGTSQVYIGDAVFVEGARPDVAAAYPD